MLELKNITKRYDEKIIFENLNVQFNQWDYWKKWQWKNDVI